MKASVLKRDRRYETRNDKAYGIQHWGEANDYPQRVLEIIAASCTGAACVDVYSKFIAGKGFNDLTFYKKVVNFKGQTNDYILELIKKDFSELGGFALHVNFNALYKVVELQHVPFENCRLEKINDETGDFDKIATHPDWGRRFLSLRKWKKDDIVFYDLFNPDPAKIQSQVEAAGGWHNYNGQIYYFSNQGEKSYPLPIADAVLTDMSTEEGISNVSYRNARNNFLSAGMLVDVVQNNDSMADNVEDSGRDRELGKSETEKTLLEFQGDENAGKILYIEVESKEEAPVFSSFKGQNYDKEFTVTTETAENKIGKRFMQPPILRSVDVGGNFGADTMKNAYNYYNSITEGERLAIERVYSEIFQHWHEATTLDFSIIPLTYQVETTLAEKLGDAKMDKLIEIISGAMSREQKKAICKTLFGLTEEEANSINIEVQ